MRLALLALLLTGCVSLPRYEWYPAAKPLEWYRWEQVERGPGFSLLCGPVPANMDKACVIRLNDAVIRPHDKNVQTGEWRGTNATGPLCLVLSTLSEEEAMRVNDQFSEYTLWAHEVLIHCGKGLDHRVINGRVN